MVIGLVQQLGWYYNIYYNKMCLIEYMCLQFFIIISLCIFPIFKIEAAGFHTSQDFTSNPNNYHYLLAKNARYYHRNMTRADKGICQINKRDIYRTFQKIGCSEICTMDIHRTFNKTRLSEHDGYIEHCFSTGGPRPGTGPWHQLYRAARGSPGICHLIFFNNFSRIDIL